LNILFLHSASDLYGSGKILADTIVILTKQNHRCTVCLPEEGPLKKELEDRGAVVIITGLGIIRRKFFSFIGILNRFFALTIAIIRLSIIIRQKKINLIYSNTTAVLAGAVVARMLRIRHIWHVHEIIVKPIGFVKFLSYFLGNYSDRVIVVSNPVKDYWSQYIKKPLPQISVIHNGIDSSRFTSSTGSNLRKELQLSSSTLVIGMIGRVHFWKGQDYFLKIAAKILNHVRDVKFIMAGDAFPGYECLYDQIAALKRRLGLDPFVIDLGFRSDIANVLHGFDIFVLPSILPDPLPTVILEAMSCSKPVVATSHGGVLDMVINEETGILIPWNNEDVALEKMSSLIDSRELRQLYGNNGLERVKKYFSMDAYEQNIKTLINSIS